MPARPPRGAGRVTSRRDARAVYFPSCVSRTMGRLPGEPAGPIAHGHAGHAGRACGHPLWIPDDVDGHCCGVPFSSKGYVEAHRLAVNRTIESVLALVRRRASPRRDRHEPVHPRPPHLPGRARRREPAAVRRPDDRGQRRVRGAHAAARRSPSSRRQGRVVSTPGLLGGEDEPVGGPRADRARLRRRGRGARRRRLLRVRGRSGLAGAGTDGQRHAPRGRGRGGAHDGRRILLEQPDVRDRPHPGDRTHVYRSHLYLLEWASRDR